MNAGMPGAGISGIFYFFCMIFMFLMALVRKLAGNESDHLRIQTVKKQVQIFLGVILSLYITYRILSWAYDYIAETSISSQASVMRATLPVNVLFANISLLIALLLGFTIFAFFIKKRSTLNIQ